jgi:hypothetical protein
MVIMNKIESIFDKTEDLIDKMMHLGDIALDAFFHLQSKGFKIFFNSCNLFLQTIFKFYKKHGKILRYASLPWSIVILKIYKWMHSNSYDRLPIFMPGMHMIRARVGGGKSLASFVLAEMTLEHTGYASYFTSPVEKPQLSEDGTYWYVMHRVINMNDYYKDGKKVMAYNTDKYKNMHKDERHLDYNPRMNKGKKYNSTFIPEHEDHLLMRHDGFDHIYMYSQHMKLDSQEMDALTLMHEVETNKDIPIQRWLEDGEFKYIPIKLKFTSYTIEVDFDGSIKRKVFKSWKIPVPYDVLKRFDTHAERNKHAGLPKDYK